MVAEATPKWGRQATRETIDELKTELEGTNLVFLSQDWAAEQEQVQYQVVAEITYAR